MKRAADLTAPRRAGGLTFQLDRDAFGSFAESIASFIGTARFLVYQTVFITVWILFNTLAPDSVVFDPWSRGFTLLTLVLSIQAAYAAPLILLAQSRQEQRDRAMAENDRAIADRTQNDTEFLAREIASVRVSLSDMITGQSFDEQVDRVTDAVERLGRRIEVLTARLDAVDGTRTSATGDADAADRPNAT